MGQIKQDLDLFKMPLELQIMTDGDPEYKRVEVVGPSSDFDVLSIASRKVVIDPRKKLLRMSDDIRVSCLHQSRRGIRRMMASTTKRSTNIRKPSTSMARNSLALFRMGEALFELGNLHWRRTCSATSLNGDLQPKWVEVWGYINMGKIFDMRGQRERAVVEYQKAINTGDDAYGAQAEAQKYLNEPFRRQPGKPTIGD